MSELDDFLAQEQAVGKAPPPTPRPDITPVPKVAPTNELDAFIAGEVQANPTILDDDSPISAPTSIRNLAPGVAQFEQTPEDNPVGDFIRRGTSEVVRSAASLGRIPDLWTKGVQNVMGLSYLLPGPPPKDNTAQRIGKTLEQDIEKLAPMKPEEIAAYQKQHPVADVVASAGGQLGALALTPGAPLKMASSLTLGAKEQHEDVLAHERKTGEPIDLKAQATAELLGAATGATDILPYQHAMRGLFRVMPDKVRQGLELKLEKWWRAQAVGARYPAETLSVALSEGFQEAGQGWGQDLTARDWVGYDPDRDPMDTLAQNAQGGFGAGVVFDAVLKTVNRRGLRTLKAEDRAFELQQDVERKKDEKAKLEATIGEAPTAPAAQLEKEVEAGKQAAQVVERQSSAEEAKLADLRNQPQPDMANFDRQASRAIDFFEPLEQVTVSDLNRFLALGVSPGEAQVVSELHNKLGTVTGKEFAKAVQSQLFPLTGVEFQPGSDNSFINAGMSYLWNAPVSGTAVSWESPIPMAAQDVKGGQPVAATHVFASRHATPTIVTQEDVRLGRQPQPPADFQEARKRAIAFRLGHLRYARNPYGDVPYIVEIQTDRIPLSGRVEPSTVLGFDPSTKATPGQERLLKGEVNQRGLRYILRNQMAKFSAEGLTQFDIVHPDHATKLHGMREGGITHNSYKMLAEWLTKNFQTREYHTTGGNIKTIRVNIPENFHMMEIPFGADLGRPLKQVQTPYTAHTQAVEDVIQSILHGNDLQAQVFKTAHLRKQVQAVRETLRLNEKELRKAQRYEGMKEGIKQLEQEIRAREAGARRLRNILNWGGSGRPPGTPSFGDPGADRLNKDDISWGLENFGTLMDLAYRNKHIRPLQDLARHVWWKHAEMMRQVHRAMETVNVLNSLSSGQRSILFKVMMQNVLDSREVQQRFTDSAIVQELQAAGAKEPTIEAYLRVRRDFAEAIVTLRDALHRNLKINLIREQKWVGDVENGRPTPEADDEYERRYGEITKNLERWNNVEYFPFLRFGKWKVRVTAQGNVVKDGDSYVAGDTVEHLHFATEEEAKEAARELQEIYASQPVSVETGMRVQSPFAVSTGVPEGFLAQLTNRLNLTDDQKHSLFEMAAKTAPSKSFIQRYLKKKMVKGYSEDGIRAYADYFYSFASYISNLKYDHLIDHYRSELRESVNQFRGQKNVDTTKRDRIIQFIEYHIDRLRANQNELAWLRQLGTFWYLGFVAKTVFVNMLQVPMILFPYLSARYPGAAGKIVDAYGGQVGNAILSSMKRILKVQNSNSLNVDKGLDDILTFLYESGKLNQSFLTELAAATSEDRIKAFSAGRARRYWHETVSLSMKPFQLLEELNRRVTAEAIYRLEMQTKHPGKSWETLTASERQSVRETVVEGMDRTMFEYSRWNRAKFQQGIKSPIFLFYGYIQGLLSFIAPFHKNSVQGVAARRAILIMLLMGGLEGLPFFGNLLDILDTLLAVAPKKFRELWGDMMEGAGVNTTTANVPDLRGQMRDLVMQLTDGDTAVRDFMMNGASKKYGLGPLHLLRMFDVNVPEVDISGSLSMGAPIPGTDELRRAVMSGNGSEAFGHLLTAVTGPIGSAASNATRAMLSNEVDQWKRWERALPTFAKGISQGVRREQRGGETNNVTDVTIPTTTGENIAAGLGFRPTSVAHEQTVQWQVQERKLWFAGRRTAILNEIERYVRANKVKDEAGGKLPDNIMKELEEYNSHAPGNYKIGRDTIKRSLKDRLKSGATEAAIGVESPKDLELLREIERLVGQPTSQPEGQ